MCMCVCVYLPNSTTNLFSSGPTGCYTFVNFFESSFFCSGNVTATARAGGRQCFFFTFLHLRKITNCHCLVAFPRQPSICLVCCQLRRHCRRCVCCRYVVQLLCMYLLQNVDFALQCSWLTESASARMCFQLSFWSQLGLDGYRIVVTSHRRVSLTVGANKIQRDLYAIFTLQQLQVCCRFHFICRHCWWCSQFAKTYVELACNPVG